MESPISLDLSGFHFNIREEHRCMILIRKPQYVKPYISFRLFKTLHLSKESVICIDQNAF